MSINFLRKAAWALGANLTADFGKGLYWLDGASSQAAIMADFTRADKAWRTAANGKTITEFAANAPRIDSRGLLIEGYDRVRLSTRPVTPADWTLESSATGATLSADGSFTPRRVSSAGSTSAGIRTPVGEVFTVASGNLVAVRSLYKNGTSGRARQKVRATTAALQSVCNGLSGVMASLSNAVGAWSQIVNLEFEAGLYGFIGSVTSNTSAADFFLGIGPDSAVAAEYLDVYGMQCVVETRAGEWILDNPTTTHTQSRDVAPIAFSGGKTIGINFTLFGFPSAATAATIWHYGNSTDFTRLLYVPASGKIFAEAYTASVEVASLDIGEIALGATHSVAFTWANSEYSASLDGATAVSDVTGTAPTGMANIYLGSNGATVGANVLVAALYALRNNV